MKIRRTLVRVLVPVSMVVLAACQTKPTAETPATAPDQTQQPATQQSSPQETTPRQQGSSMGAPVAVFLADTTMQDGWRPVELDAGTLYLNPQPVVIRDDLTGVQAGSNKDGDGLLALELSPEGQRKVTQATTDNPNKRLALIVGQTMLAAPGYNSPVTTGHLIFAVGTEQNATAAARAIAGVPDDGSGDSQATRVPGNSSTEGAASSGVPSTTGTTGASGSGVAPGAAGNTGAGRAAQ